MLHTKDDLIDGGFERRYTVNIIDTNAIIQAKEIFSQYKDNGVILGGNFLDPIWKLTNQITTVSFKFEFDNLNYQKNTKRWMGCSYQYFVKAIKAYILFKLGRHGLRQLQGLIRSFHQLVKYSYAEVLEKNIKNTENIVELLKMLEYPCQSRDSLIEYLEEAYVYKRKDRSQRLLANFNTYFAFHEAMDVFWNNADKVVKVQFFPLRLWWTLTSILPLRPTEFLLIPYDCISCIDGQWVLSIRRTMIKGSSKKKTYRIDTDYSISKYVITSIMANEILEYLELTENMHKSKLDTLFSQEPHGMLVEKNICNNNNYYSYTNLSTCLRKFQENYMQSNNNNYHSINLGDTRHIAMINLIISGGSPTICKELAGHHDINISSHYYSNISRFIECATYQAYKKASQGSAEIRKHRPASLKQNLVKVDAGYCDSTKFKQGQIDDCIKNIGSSGEIGNCIDCPHLVDGKHGMYIAFSDVTKYKKQVDKDSKLLIQAIDTVRKGIGFKEDIQSALLRLQHSSAWYSKCLHNELEVNKNGKTT